MMLREKLKYFAIKHEKLLKVYRCTFGKIKTDWYFGMQKKALQKRGYLLIEKIENALTKENAVFFIDCGSLLGLIRDGHLLKHDRDLDYGIYFSETFTPAKLDGVMQKIGLKKHKLFSLEGDIKEITYGNGILSIDFFLHEETDMNSNIYIFYRKPDIIYPSNNHYTPLVMHRARIRGIETTEINNIKIHVPSNAEEYLASVYTKLWKIPDPTWHYLMEPGLEEIKDKFGIRQKV